MRRAPWLPTAATGAVCLLLYVAAAVSFSGFASPQVAANFVVDNAVVGILALGLTFVILTGGIDLSVGSMAAFSTTLFAHLVQNQKWPVWAAAALCLASGAALGSFQGWLVARFRIAPFLVTLAGLFLCGGLALMTSREAIQIDSETVSALSLWSLPVGPSAKVGFVGVVFLVALAAAALGARQTRFGRVVYAIGGGRASAELMGLDVNRTLVRVYALSGTCAALGGLLNSFYTASGNPLSGRGVELDAIAAVVVGGTLLSGGYGSVLGTFLGVLILAIIQSAITFQGTLNSWWAKIAIGALLLIFLLLQRFLGASGRKEAANRA